jgi:hypothetical protein
LHVCDGARLRDCRVLTRVKARYVVEHDAARCDGVRPAGRLGGRRKGGHPCHQEVKLTSETRLIIRVSKENVFFIPLFFNIGVSNAV